MSDLAKQLQEIYSTHQSGDVISAEIRIRELLKEHPENPDILRLGALTALAVNQIVTADQRIVQAASLTPMTAEMANTRGNILKAAGDWAGAKECYDMAREIDADYSLTHVNELDMYLQSGQPRAALDLLENGRELGELGRYARAQALTDLGEFEVADAIIEGDWSDANKDHLDLLKAKILSGLGRIEEMKDLVSSISSTSAFLPQVLEIVTNSFEMRGNRDQALDMIAMATAGDQVTAPTFVKASQLLDRLGHRSGSQDLMKLAGTRLGDHPDLLGEMARLAFVDGDAAKSCELYRQALTLRPGSLTLLMGYLEPAIAEKDYQTAQQLLQGALNQAPNNQYLYAMGATLQRAMGGKYTGLYDYENFVKIYDITPPEGYSDIESFNSVLKETLLQRHSQKGTPVNQSLRKGTQTEVDLSQSDDPILLSFFEAVGSSINDYIDALPTDPDHPLARRKRDDYRIAGAWSVHLSDQGHHVDHVHPLGWLSSSYYVDVPDSVNETDNAGWIKFGEHPAKALEQTAEKYIQPKAGQLVLFPSYMWHGTVPFKGPETRLTLPFDVVPA